MSNDETFDGEIVNDDEESYLPATSTVTPVMIPDELLDIQIATAKKYPRSIEAFQRTALQRATKTAEIAGSMFYLLKRGSKKIEGPSIRLAEICGPAWTNMRAAARPIEETRDFITCQGMAFDLEANYAVQMTVRRRITNSFGQRFNADMIGMTVNAANSIAYRNALFKVIPLAYVKDIMTKAKEVSLGKGLTHDERVAKMLEAYKKDLNIDQKTLLEIVEKKGLEDIDVDTLIDLRGYYTALRDGETTLNALLEKEEETKKTGPQRKSASKPPANGGTENPPPSNPVKSTTETSKQEPKPETPPINPDVKIDNTPEPEPPKPAAAAENTADKPKRGRPPGSGAKKEKPAPEGSEWAIVGIEEIGKTQPMPTGGSRYSFKADGQWYSYFSPEFNEVIGESFRGKKPVQVNRLWNAQYNNFKLLAVKET